MITDISVKECFSEGWQCYKRHMGLSIGVAITFGIILISLSLIPYVRHAFSYFISPALGVGLYLYFLNVARDTNPSFGDLFAGFRRYGFCLGLFVMWFPVYLVALLPTYLIYGFVPVARLAIGIAKPGEASLGLVGCYGLNSMIFFALLYRFWQVYFVMFDEPQLSIVDCLKRSSDITKGNGHNVFLLAIVSSFIFLGLTIALFIPALVFGPMLCVAFARMYLKLKAMHTEPLPVTISPPVL